jgi:cbb3-type cytochrome c oxidase subunit III
VTSDRRDVATIEAILVIVVLLLIVGAGVLGGYIGRITDSSGSTTTATETTVAVDPAVAAGAHTFQTFACAQCHGLNGRGGVNPNVPALTDASKTLSVAELHTIINKGLGESSNPTKPFMPVWGPLMSAQQVSDLVAYIRAGLPDVPDATPVAVPQGQGQAVAGAALYVRYGCINCHGPNGLGGVPNPQSADKAIPALAGQDFRTEFNTDEKIKEMIRAGSVIGKPPIASMPHWGGIISEENLNNLVAYLKTLQ